MSLLSAAVLLFLVLDPLGNIPLFLSALRHIDPALHRRIILRELVIALLVLVFFLFAGRPFLELLQISEPALSISGGIILFLIAIRMIFWASQGVFVERIEGEPFIVPLAVPYVAGPSAMATVMLLINREPERWPEWLLSLQLAWLVSGIILLFSSNLSRLLGKHVLIAMERLMGMILTTVAVQMFMAGITRFLCLTQP